jgi:predicted DNA-binding antitoxin AbrB/MazE fold protein
MTRTLEAVYEGGLLRPLEPLLLKERQKVTLTVVEAAEDPLAPYLDSISARGLRTNVDRKSKPSLEEVRAALSGIRGSLSDDIRAERERR